MNLEEAMAALEKSQPGFSDGVEAEHALYSFVASVRARLRVLRRDAGVSQLEIARRLGMGQSAVSRLERGRGDIGVLTVARYAAALGLSPQQPFVVEHSGDEEILQKLLTVLETTQDSAGHGHQSLVARRRLRAARTKRVKNKIRKNKKIIHDKVVLSDPRIQIDYNDDFDELFEDGVVLDAPQVDEV